MSEIRELSVRGPATMGLMACAVLLLGLFGWAARAAIISAVVASGEVDVAPFTHPVQHPDGGVVAEVLVREGQVVNAGDVLIRLDDRTLATEMDFIQSQIIEGEARQVRLRAERDGADFPPIHLSMMYDRARVVALGAQLRLFDARRETFERHQQQLVQRRRQSEAELEGLIAQRVEVDAEAALLREELENQQELRRRGLAVSAQVSELARANARLQASRAGLEARDTELRGEVAEIALQSASLQAERREEAEVQFAETGLQLIELRARRAAMQARLDALELRAPATGVVHALMLPAPETVLRPAQEVMQILAAPPEPVLTVRVSPDEIDHIERGQRAFLRFPALASRNLPDLPGVVTNVSAATFADERTGQRHFRVQIVPTPETLRVIDRAELVPGMSVQAFIATGMRTPLAYLVDPIRDHFARALREP